MSEVKRYFADLISAYDTVPVENIHDVQVVLATDYATLEAERDALQKHLAEREAELKKVNADRLSCWAEFKVMTRACLEAEKQRDKLAGLLRTIAVGISKREMPTEQQLNAWFDQIDAALAEVE